MSEAAHSPSISYWIYEWAATQLHSPYDFMTYAGKIVSLYLAGNFIKSSDEVGSVVKVLGSELAPEISVWKMKPMNDAVEHVGVQLNIHGVLTSPSLV